MTERIVSVYVLCDGRVPDSVARVRYVGVTSRSLEARLRGHWDRVTADEQTHRARWMRSVRSAGGYVTIEEIARVPLMFAESAEIDYIERYRHLGADLTNTTAGGRGLLHPSAETRAKMSASALGHLRWVGRRHTPESREKMRAWHLQKPPPSADHRQKLSLALRGSRTHLAKLSWEQVAEIRSRVSTSDGDVTSESLSREFGVSSRTIRDVIRNSTWVSA